MLKLSRSGITTLKRQYKSVLMKCLLINAGILLSANVASAADIVITGGTAYTGADTSATVTDQTINYVTKSEGDTLAAAINTLNGGESTPGSVANAMKGLTTAIENGTIKAGEAGSLTGLTASVAELNYVDGVTSNIQTQLDGKQANLNTDQLAAVNSGITAAKVSAYEGYATTIAGKQDALNTDQLAAANSGITAAKVSAYEGYATTIAGKQDALNTDQLAAANSGITAAKVSTYDGYATAIAGKQATLNSDQLAAANSGVTSTKVGQYDALVTASASYGDIVSHNASEFQTTLSSDQLAAANSGINSTKVGTYDTVASAVNNTTTGLAATYTLANGAVQSANLNDASLDINANSLKVGGKDVLTTESSVDVANISTTNYDSSALKTAVTGTKVTAAGTADTAKAVTSDAIDGSTIVLNGSGKIEVGSITHAKVSDFDTQVNADIATSVASGAIKTALDTKQDNLVIASGSGLSMASDGKTLSVSGVTSAMIENGTITGTDIANQTITGNNLVNKTVTATQIADNTITADQIATNAITDSELADNAVDTAAIKGGAVTLAKLNADVYTGTATASSAQLMTSGGVYAITNVAAGGNYISAGTDVAGNLTALDGAIGAKIGSDGNFIKSSTTNSVNSNILALDGAIGDLSGFASQNYAKNTSNVAANITALDGALKSTNDILGTAETAAISPTSLVTGKIGSEVTVVNALRTVADNAAGLHLDNTFDGANTFKNDAGITIQDTAGTNSASLTATAINFTDISGTGPSSVTDVLKVDTGMLVDDRVATTQGFSIVNNTSGSNYTEVFNIDANGHITSDVLTTTATGVTLGAATGTNSILGTKTTIAGTTEVATLKFAGDETATAIDAGGTAKTSTSTGNSTTLATVASVLKSAENATFTASGATASNITADTTLNEAIDTLDAKMGKVASVDVNGYETADASKRTLEGAVSALNDNMEAVIGGAYKADGSYDNSVFEATTPNGFETGATSLTDALTKYADNALAATGVAYGADGAVATTYTKATSTDYDGLNANSSLRVAIEQLDGNIGTAISGTTRSVAGGTTAAASTVNANIAALDAAIGGDVSGAKGNIAKNKTVNQNLDAIDVAIGDRAYKNDIAVNYAAVTTGADLTTAISQVASNVGTATTTGYNGVEAGKTVNANIDAVNAQIGDWANLHGTYTAGASEGNALTNGGQSNPTTVVVALNNIDATLGTIHGLATKLEESGNYYGNLASGTTVEQHLSALDTAIGDRSRFNDMHYTKGANSVVDAIGKLDTGLNDLDHEVRRLRHHFEGGMASAAALSALQPNARATGDTQLAIGTGAYRGHGAMAIGGYHWFTDNLLVNVGVAHDNREATYRMGVTYSW